MLKIQFLNGGLANQTFQYIFARHYELLHPGEVMYLDDSYFALNTVHNGYELGKVFGLKPHMLSEAFDADVWEYMLDERRKGKSIPQIIADNGEDIIMVEECPGNVFNPFNGKIVYPSHNGYCPKIQDVPENVYYQGYWIDKGWFVAHEKIFKKELSFPPLPLDDTQNRKIMDRIIDENSVALHVRRGDYVDKGYAYGAETYKDWLESYAQSCGYDWTVFVFSDDMEWCRQNSVEMGLDKFQDTVFVEGNIDGKNYIDMQLMSHCKGMVMSNSAFSYLAALLNDEKIYCVMPNSRKL